MSRHTKCEGETGSYCSVAHPTLRQTGNGYEKACPVCGKLYGTPVPKPLKEETNKPQSKSPNVWNIPNWKSI